jgi:hypothetical protein
MGDRFVAWNGNHTRNAFSRRNRLAHVFTIMNDGTAGAALHASPRGIFSNIATTSPLRVPADGPCQNEDGLDAKSFS